VLVDIKDVFIISERIVDAISNSSQHKTTNDRIKIKEKYELLKKVKTFDEAEKLAKTEFVAKLLIDFLKDRCRV